jgi:hypothetical protein
MEKRIRENARWFAVSHVTRLAFEGRKGHGGGKCTKRVLTPDQLKRELNHAISRYEDGIQFYSSHPEKLKTR